MSNHRITNLGWACALGLTGCIGATTATEQEAQISGAIFTTTADGSRVNANIYTSKDDVYLDGGPGPNAPPGAAGLPAGDYYFQVTNPNGRVLLSTDDISCREFHVNDNGVIDRVVGACVHQTGVDRDQAQLGAITVQLMPYADTPNLGGEYKVWATPIDLYDPVFARTHGFRPADSKTDNFKVRIFTTPPPEVCGNGILEPGEQCDDGNNVDGDGCSSDCVTETPPTCGH